MHRILLNRIPFIAKKSKTPGYLSFMFRMNHFQIFDIDTKYNINKLYLNQSYKTLQNSINRNDYITEEEKHYLLFLSNYVNDAYYTLNNDYERSVYLLYLKGLVVKEDESFNKYIEIEEILNEMDNTSELQSLKERVNERIEEIKNEYTKHLENNELIEAKNKAILLYYYIDIEKQIYYKINE
jgi:molecular chaperone HscB